MRSFLNPVLAGAILATAAAAAPAVARDSQTHVMTVQLPGGSQEQILYTGDAPPRIVFAPDPFPFPAFAALEPMAALLGQQADMMLRQAASLPGLTEASLSNLPPGVHGYAVVTTFSSNGACARTTAITYGGGNTAPQTVSSTSGDCGGQPGGTVPVRASPQAPESRPLAPSGLIQVKSPSAKPWGGLLREASLAQ